VTRPELLKKLNDLLEKAEKENTFGCIEIELRGGRATVIRKTETDRLDRYEDNGEKTHARSTYR
jgi:hypothetical protein